MMPHQHSNLQNLYPQSHQPPGPYLVTYENYRNTSQFGHSMPQDPGLYGQPRPKKQRREIAVSDSLSFTAQLTSLLSPEASSSLAAAPLAKSTAARPRPSKLKGDLVGTKVKRKTNGKVAQDNKLVLKDVVGTEDDKAERARAKRKMEEKARLYAAMKRGDYVAKEGEAAPLVDFDRKWAEEKAAGGRSSSGSEYGDENDDDDGNGVDTEQIEYTDEFGRLRRGTRADKERMERRLARGVSSAAELERMSARPKAPDKLIYGDTVQVNAFVTDDADAMEALARKRDRSATPPDALHFDASAEIRTKGVGFYAFSKDEAERQREMRSLEEERQRTERGRLEREQAREARSREVARRREEMARRRAEKMADSFLNGLAANMVGEQVAAATGTRDGSAVEPTSEQTSTAQSDNQ